jgi:hypothetical protein
MGEWQNEGAAGGAHFNRGHFNRSAPLTEPETTVLPQPKSLAARAGRRKLVAENDRRDRAVNACGKRSSCEPGPAGGAEARGRTSPSKDFAVEGLLARHQSVIAEVLRVRDALGRKLTVGR